MHFCVLAFFENKKTVADVEEAAMALLGPYGEGREWDWFQVGGRWTGLFDGYNPNKDPKNRVKCQYCNGTGKRKDMVVEGGCNGCNGTGKELKWPTDWKTRKGDILPVSKLTKKHLEGVCAVCCEGYGWLGGDEYVPWAEDLKSKFKPREFPSLKWLKKQYAKGVVVVIDCHN